MGEHLSDFLWGTLCVLAGLLILLNTDSLALFDQQSGIRSKAWFREKMGNSVLNRDLWTPGTPSGLRRSKAGFRIVGVIFLLAGTVLLGFSVRGRFP